MKLNPPLLALAAGAFGIGVTEFAPDGPAAGDRAGSGRLHSRRRAADQRLCAGRHARRTADDADHWTRAAPDPADRPRGDLHHRQPSLGGVGQLRHAALRPRRHLAQPRRLLRRRLGRRGEPGAAGPARRRGRGDVHGADHRQCRRRAARHLGGRPSRLARLLLGHIRARRRHHGGAAPDLACTAVAGRRQHHGGTARADSRARCSRRWR